MSDSQDYTVGWICAITTEFVAAQAFLDERHDGPREVSHNDSNNYALGKLGNHNVVIAVLPDGEYGIASAAVVAGDMLHSFPNIRLGLMVGIGGGAPSQKHDIRLGDIVVSSPRDGKGGVLQYDFGKTIQNQSFLETGFLNQPPKVLRTAVGGLKAMYEANGHQLDEDVKRVVGKKPRLRKKYSRPHPRSDRLYKSDIVHAQDTEEGCIELCGDDSTHLVPRRERDEDEDSPAVHYGLIASANQLMKDALIRDRLAAEKDVLCFEMEAAGLMNHFPCLVIRGICDYSDSHKNKGWQGFAAMVAVAYAKDLLRQIPPNKIEAERRVAEVLGSIHEDVSQIRSATKSLQQSQHFQEVMKWLSPPDPSTNYNKACQQRHECTGQWFLESKEYSEWKKSPKSSLWLHGIPGCGKTILSSTVIKDLSNIQPYAKNLLYFYFDFTDTSKQSLEKAVRSLIAQLYSKSQDVQAHLNSLYSSCKNASRQPSIDSLISIFEAIAQQTGEVWIVLDALDECQKRTGLSNEGLLYWIEGILNLPQVNIHLLVTSRPEHDIKSALERYINNQIPLQSDLVTDDIRAYIHGTVRQHEGFKRWRTREEILDEIEGHLMEKANRMFRWVSCQLDALEKCPDPNSLRQTLQSLPRTLDETYAQVLRRIPPEFEQNAKRILQFLTFSERPLRIEEAVNIITVVTENNPRFDAKNRMPQPDEVSIYCSSLVAIITRGGKSGETEVKELQLAHFSVKEYLISDRLEQNISEAFGEPVAKASIVEVCLAYLLDLDHSLSLLEVRQSYPLAQYSARYWMDHAIRIETAMARKLIKEFCLHKDSPKVCYGLYNADRPWEEEPERFKKEKTPVLYHIAHGGILYAVEELLKNGADIHAQGGEYGNALQAASFNGNKEVIQILLDKGADIHAQGGHFGNALQAASFNGHKDVIQILLDKGADITVADKDGWTALHEASANGHLLVVKLLLDKGADLSVASKGGWTPLHEASSKGHLEVLKLLLDKGADIYGMDNDGRTAFFHAAMRGHRQVVQFLLSKKASVNSKDRYNATPLITASRNGHGDTVELLLEAENVCIDCRDEFGRTALCWARKSRNDPTVQLLLRNVEGALPQGSGADVLADNGSTLFDVSLSWCRVCTICIPVGSAWTALMLVLDARTKLTNGDCMNQIRMLDDCGTFKIESTSQRSPAQLVLEPAFLEKHERRCSLCMLHSVRRRLTSPAKQWGPKQRCVPDKGPGAATGPGPRVVRLNPASARHVQPLPAPISTLQDSSTLSSLRLTVEETASARERLQDDCCAGPQTDTLGGDLRSEIDFTQGSKHASVDELLAATTKARESLDARSWSFTRNGKKVIVRDVLTKVAKWVHHFKEVCDIAVQYDPGHAALPWAGVRFLLNVAVGDLDTYSSILERIADIAEFICRNALMESVLKSVSSAAAEELRRAMVKLYASILTYLAKARSYYSENTAGESTRFFASTFTAITEAQNDVTQRSAILGLEAQLELRGELQQMLKNFDAPVQRWNAALAALADQLDVKRRVEILSWISTEPY
ncbi:pfs domain-containing protein [Colletotrichum salicis]|uniref:Pfs domain-containing protein n=1 Tax=Colletotrichum salicis TaxID=1209931 RepID=A0A135TBH6_9PEZI|nr:pfs domain-containing protein [Colletotrichum salicis]